MSFELDPKLAADTLYVGDLALSRLLLMNDARWDWLILVPRRAGLTEIFDLTPAERAALIEEIAEIAKVLSARANVEKVNVGALGNIVRQLHVHVVARRVGDAAWPGPVWGAGAATPHDEAAARARVDEIRRALGYRGASDRRDLPPERHTSSTSLEVDASARLERVDREPP